MFENLNEKLTTLKQQRDELVQWKTLLEKKKADKVRMLIINFDPIFYRLCLLLLHSWLYSELNSYLFSILLIIDCFFLSLVKIPLKDEDKEIVEEIKTRIEAATKRRDSAKTNEVHHSNSKEY